MMTCSTRRRWGRGICWSGRSRGCGERQRAALQSQTMSKLAVRSVPRPVSAHALRHFARQVAERFDPERIILFGSYAYGRPHADSDVDILVVMPARNEIDKAVQIWQAIDPPFALDLIVRTPHNLRWRLQEGDWFL